jgi:hypothetical protein
MEGLPLDDRAAWEAGWSRRKSGSKYQTRRKRDGSRKNEEKEDKDEIWDAADEYWADEDEDYFDHEDDDGSWDLADS